MKKIQQNRHIKKPAALLVSENNTNTQICTDLRRFSPLFEDLNCSKIDSCRFIVPISVVEIVDKFFIKNY